MNKQQIERLRRRITLLEECAQMEPDLEERITLNNMIFRLRRQLSS